jgi:hypothetical protein
MNGLGFRPLRYQDGTGPQGVTLIEQFNNLFSQNRIEELALLVQRNPETFFDMERLPSNISGIVKELVDQKLVTLPPTAEAITEGTEGNLGRVPQMPVPTQQMQQMQMPTQQQVDPGHWEAMMERIKPDLRSAPADFSRAPVDVGTMMGGNLGRMTGPSVSQPSDRVLEMAGKRRMTGPSVSRPVDTMGLYPTELPRPSDRVLEMEGNLGRLRGYAHGGYASRGTVAGELPRYGDMSVREEGETMRELSKRHRDQDWYNRMGGGLGSLRRRMA